MKNIHPQFTRWQTLSIAGLLLATVASSGWAATVTMFAIGLNNPRGLKFGPDGNLYVAEGGTGGTNASDTGDQVVAPVGPYTGNVTGARISKIDAKGLRTTVIDNLPSSQTTLESGASVSGVGDVAFVGDTLYALLTGAGASHGVPTIPNGIIKVKANGKFKMIADLSAYYMTHPVANPSPNDFEPDGVPYSMIASGGAFYVLEPNRGSFDRITLDGQISRVLDTSVNFGTVYVPTVVTHHKGFFYIGNIDSFIQGGGNVLKVDSAGNATIAYSGFTDILGIATKGDKIYVLEDATGDQSQGPLPMTGDVIEIDTTTGTQTVIADGLFYPTGITVGPDGALYVSNVGFGPAPNGLGVILKIVL